MIYVIQVFHILLYRVPDDGQRNCPKHVEYYSKNKFEKIVHLVGFIIIIVCHIVSFVLSAFRRETTNCIEHKMLATR